MLRVFSVALICGWLTATAASAQGTGRDANLEVRQAIQTSIIAKWEDAYRRQEAAAIADLFVQDGDFLGLLGTGHYSGREAIKAAIQSSFDAGFRSQETKITKAHSFGSSAYAFGEYSLSGQNTQNNTPMKVTARWTSVYEYGSEGWKVRHLALTPIPQPPAR